MKKPRRKKSRRVVLGVGRLTYWNMTGVVSLHNGASWLSSTKPKLRGKREVHNKRVRLVAEVL